MQMEFIIQIELHETSCILCYIYLFFGKYFGLHVRVVQKLE